MKLFKIIKLITYYLIDLVKSNLSVAHDIITPGEMGKPQVFKLQVESTKDIHLFILTCLITMTPGSLCLKISEDKKYIWIHYLYPDSRSDLVNTIRNKYEKTLMEIF